MYGECQVTNLERHTKSRTGTGGTNSKIIRSFSRYGDIGILDFQLIGGPLEDNIAWANVVVYVSSTVGLNAISRGVPAVAIDLGEFVDYDPAPGDCPLKWSVSRPEQLLKAFQEIQETGDEDYRRLQTHAVEFTNRYFNPVTDKSLMEFSTMITGGDGS